MKLTHRLDGLTQKIISDKSTALATEDTAC
jgi:hypothetical protein